MIDYCPPCEPIDWVDVDEALIVVNKPAGLLTVPGRGEARQDCLIHRVQQTYPDARIVHRLDMATSGLLLLARGPLIHRALSGEFMHRRVTKTYVAVVAGLPADDEGTIDLPLICDWPNRPRQMVDFERGKPSLTHYKVLSWDREVRTARVALMPVTGRSHQLRVHLASLGHPILGDELYSGEGAGKTTRLLLHASDLAFYHPLTGQHRVFHRDPPF